MTRKLRVHAHIVKRARQDGDEDRARVGTGCRRGVVIAPLTGGYRSNYEPNQDDEPSDSHMNLPKTGGSCFSEEPRSRDVLSSTPLAADTRAGEGPDAAYSVPRGTSTISAARFPGRCIVSADGLGCRDRAAHGLWIVNEVCDQVEIASDETGTTIRLHINLRPCRPL